MLEAALVLPILLLLAFGTVEFGYFLYVNHNLQGAAMAGVRAAIPSGANNADVSQAVGDVMTACGLQGSGYTVVITPGDVSTAAAGGNVSVRVECTWGAVGVSPLGLISAGKVVRSTALMRKE